MDRSDDDRHGADASARRDVVVPMALYKVVTVFSMLIAIVFVVVGFAVVDVATDRGTAAPEEIDVLVALAGVAFVVAGGAVYVFSTRFRGDGMENAKEDTDEPSGNG